MQHPTTRRRDERGATLVEAAFVYPLLFLAIFALVEFGLAFKDWLTVSNSAREGARAGATFGADSHTDMEILRAVERTMGLAHIIDGTRVRVFDPVGSNPATTYTYSQGTHGLSPLPGELTCDWDPCPNPDRVLDYSAPNWLPSNRDVSAPFTERIGVEVEFTHRWLTGMIMNGMSDFSSETDFQIEPQVFD